MRISVGIDIAKDIHWICAIDAEGVIRLDRRLENNPAAIAAIVEDLHALNGDVRIGLDVIGGIAALVGAMLADAGFALVHVPGLAVNRARQGTTGGEHKSDPRDARIIAEQVRIRADLRPISAMSELDVDIRLLVGRRRDLAMAQTQRLNRLRDLLVSIFPGLERSFDFVTKGPLHLVTKFVTPGELRDAGRKRLLRHMQGAKGVPHVEAIVDKALLAAAEQTVSIPGERMTARLVRELAAEALAARAKLAEIDRELEETLARHPDAALVRSLPGMGVVLTAELIAEAGTLSRFRSADALAAAAGVAPVLRQSGRVRFLRRPHGGNRGLKRVFYQSAFCSLAHPDSKTFYERKRREGKHHHQAVIALARRRINVLWAVLQSRQPFQTGFKTAA